MPGAETVRGMGGRVLAPGRTQLALEQGGSRLLQSHLGGKEGKGLTTC